MEPESNLGRKQVARIRYRPITSLGRVSDEESDEQLRKLFALLARSSPPPPSATTGPSLPPPFLGWRSRFQRKEMVVLRGGGGGSCRRWHMVVVAVVRGCLICTDRVRHQTTDRVRHQTTDRVRHQNTNQTPRTDIRPRTESEITGKNSVCDFFGRTESEAKRRTESGVRVRRPLSNAQTTDRVRGPSLGLWSDLLANSPLGKAGLKESNKKVLKSQDRGNTVLCLGVQGDQEITTQTLTDALNLVTFSGEKTGQEAGTRMIGAKV
ncbi:hypothetical protein LXL04_030159 [Taraxacum kok-saghyz]